MHVINYNIIFQMQTRGLRVADADAQPVLGFYVILAFVIEFRFHIYHIISRARRNIADEYWFKVSSCIIINTQFCEGLRVSMADKQINTLHTENVNKGRAHNSIGNYNNS